MFLAPQIFVVLLAAANDQSGTIRDNPIVPVTIRVFQKRSAASFFENPDCSTLVVCCKEQNNNKSRGRRFGGRPAREALFQVVAFFFF
jgi:hypothetical protein